MARPSIVNKQRLRARISTFASYTEIYISSLIMVGIIILSFRVIYDIWDIAMAMITRTDYPSIEHFLSTALELIIGIEFIKMLAKHTPSSAVEVLLYAIARKIIGEHGTMVDTLIGVIAISLLFFVRKYLSNSAYQSDHNEFVVNGGISVPEINKIIGCELSRDYGNTAAGIIANIAKQNEEMLEPGYEVIVDGMLFQVYSMDSNLIKQIKIVYDEKEPLMRVIDGFKNKEKYTKGV